MAKGKGKDTHSYKGWLNSDKFWKRALAVAGYSAVGTLMVYGVLLVIYLILAMFA